MSTLPASPDVGPLYSLWSVQDTLLQYYRSMFIMVESVLLAVAASVAVAAKPFTWPLIIVGVALLIVWSKVTKSRSRDVQFAQQLIRWHEAGKFVATPLTIFKRYQDEWPEHQQFVVEFLGGQSEPFEAEGVWPPRVGHKWNVFSWSPRLLMENALPAVCLVSWVVIIANVAVSGLG